MRKITGLLIAIIIGFMLLSGCESSSGTTVSRVVQSGDWIYYTNLKENALYKVKTDWTEKTKFPEDTIGTDYFVVQGDTIYFFDAEGDISKIQTDGTEAAKIADIDEKGMFGFQVSGERIYYCIKPGSIYKIKTDGTGESKIADISSFSGDYLVSGDWIYYTDGTSLSKMMTDGTGVAKLSDNVGVYAVKDDWIYYGEKTDKGEVKNIFRMKLDGTEKSMLTDGAYVAIDGDWFYYTKENWLYRSNLDGTTVEKMNKVEMWNIFGVYGDYIYYGEYSGAAYRINLDGSNKTRLE